VGGEQISSLPRCFQPPDLLAAGNKDIGYSPGMPVVGGRQGREFLIRLRGRSRHGSHALYRISLGSECARPPPAKIREPSDDTAGVSGRRSNPTLIWRDERPSSSSAESSGGPAQRRPLQAPPVRRPAVSPAGHPMTPRLDCNITAGQRLVHQGTVLAVEYCLVHSAGYCLQKARHL
jgi:hypothetical protein